jgi:hypothetical protein
VSTAGWIILALGAALTVTVLLLIFWRRRNAGPTDAQITAQTDVAQAKAEARAAVAAHGATVARQMVLAEYRAALAALDAEQARRAKELEDDPEELAGFLVSAAGGKPVRQ